MSDEPSIPQPSSEPDPVVDFSPRTPEELTEQVRGFYFRNNEDPE